MEKLDFNVLSLSKGITDDTVFVIGEKKDTGKNFAALMSVTKENKKIIKEFEFDSAIIAIATNEKDRRFIAAVVGSQLLIFNRKFIEILRFDLDSKESFIKYLEFSPDGDKILAIDTCNNLFLFSISKAKMVAKMNGSGLVNCATFLEINPNEYCIAVINEKKFKLLKANDELTPISSNNDIFKFVPLGIFSEDSVIIVIGVNTTMSQSAIIELKIVDNAVRASRIVHPIPGQITSVTPSEKTIAIGTKDGAVFILNRNSLGRQRVVNKALKEPVIAMCTCQHNVIAASRHGLIRIVPNHARTEQIFFLSALMIIALAITVFVIYKFNQ